MSHKGKADWVLPSEGLLQTTYVLSEWLTKSSAIITTNTLSLALNQLFNLLKLLVAVLLVLQCIIYCCPEVNLTSSWLLNMVDYFFLNLRLVRKYPSVVTGLSVTGRPRPHLQTKPIFNLFSQGFWKVVTLSSLI